ncbi:related to pyridoxamine phosphate oxidase [Cephalotrichum gorgonifer]|uniref:Related to pyridoxamine phosphate oxidase n=1 Tax=Cephalotrichum gorgonifer TaxID=2041049 RepID=A0AAE8MTM1_9PEZI|nr:related to pyridoxamine phosphate oxidase [Cephalotrichum gorgonifer]
MEQQIPLNYEASAGDTNKQVTTTLPPEVVQCLENARFLHLATCVDNIPNVSLMSYTYLAESPYSSSPVIIMTTNNESKKTNNLLANQNVSLLVHDWVSHRPSRRLSGGSPHPPPSSLASLLQNLNSEAMSSISATINGSATLLPPSYPEERYYRERHLENNTFSDPFSSAPSRDDALENGTGTQDGERECFVAGDDVRVVVVDIKDVRISDWKGGVRDWVIVREGEMVNGVR